MDNLLTSIGRHLGMAIEKARLDEEAQRLDHHRGAHPSGP
jgi:two-component system, NarL family, nitrate/nitrite sensor histidine kinase NarX